MVEGQDLLCDDAVVHLAAQFDLQLPFGAGGDGELGEGLAGLVAVWCDRGVEELIDKDSLFQPFLTRLTEWPGIGGAKTSVILPTGKLALTVTSMVTFG